MRKTIALAWEQRKGGKTPRNQAQKLNTVKHGPMSHPLNNNRVMVNEEVAVTEEIVLGMAGTSKAQETRPSLPSKPNLRLVLLNHLLLLPQLPLLTPSSSVTSCPPLSRFCLHRPHHSTRALTKLYL